MKKQFTLLLFLLFVTSPLSAQWFGLTTPGIPRTADGSIDSSAPIPRDPNGQPDLSGIWVPGGATGTLFDADKIQDWALDAMVAQENSFYTNDPRFHCLPSGPGSYPAGMSVGGMRRILQHPSMIAVLNSEMNYRQIFMDGRELEENPILPTWEGYSVGYWEGDTLVVESNGFNDKTWLTREGLPHTAQLHLTERYTRLNYNQMELEISYNDPGTFTEPVQATFIMGLRVDTEILETVCNESATGQSHYSGEITQAEAKLIEITDEQLADYAGTYQGLWLGNVITTEFVIEDGEMVLLRTPRYSDTGGNTDTAKYRLVAQSENAFDCTCGLGFIFNFDENQNVISVEEVHVSGAWAFNRVE